MPPWIVCQGGYACGCAACVRGERECAQLHSRSRCACRGACGDTLLFRAWGDARRGPSAERGDGHTLTLRVDTHPPQEGPTYTHTRQSLLPLFHQHFRGGELPRIALRSLCKPLPLAASWIRSCEEQKNSEVKRQDENYLRQMSKLHAANVPTWRAPFNTKKSRINGKHSNEGKY